jgi:hypothetical protein
MRRLLGHALVVGLVALALQSCSIWRFDLRNKLENVGPGRPSCEIRYSITVASAYNPQTVDGREFQERMLRKARDKYVADTGDVLRGKGCGTAYVEHNDEATLEIRIEDRSRLKSLPQEWLTILSFGLIPSWTTRKSEYVYSFTDKASGTTHRYTVDTKGYNHLILTPLYFIWVFTLDKDQRNVYKDALTNFLEHPSPTLPELTAEG